MAAPKVDIRQDDDGGYSLVATIDGVDVTFGRVNPSQLAEAAQQQGKPAPQLPAGDETEPES